MCVCYLGLCIGLQSEQTAHLDILGVNDSSSNKVSWIWIHSVQQGHSEPQDLKDQEKGTRLMCSRSHSSESSLLFSLAPARLAIYFRSFNGIQNIQRCKTIYYTVIFTNQALLGTRWLTVIVEDRSRNTSVCFYLGLGDLCVHGVFGFEDFLNLLLRTRKETRK